MAVSESLVKVGVSAADRYGFPRELPARSMANPEQPPASCFTADWGETKKKRPLCSVRSRGEALASSPHTAATVCMKKHKQPSSSGQSRDH